MRTRADRACRPAATSACLLIGYFEGLDAERAIAWRAADLFALRHQRPGRLSVQAGEQAQARLRIANAVDTLWLAGEPSAPAGRASVRTCIAGES